jgi:hypothetical protein
MGVALDAALKDGGVEFCLALWLAWLIFFNRKRGSKVIFEKGYYFFLTTLPGHTCREKIHDPED